MTLDEFLRYCQEQGWHCVSNAAFGVERGYPFAAIYRTGGRGAGTVQLQFQVAGRLTGATLRSLRKTLPRGCTIQPSNQAGSLAVQCSAAGEGLLPNFQRTLEACTGALREAMLPVPDTCPLCRQPGCDALARVNGYVPAHAACVQSQTQDTLARAEANQVSGNYVTGLIGALLGGVVGSIPALLCLYFLEYYVGILYMLIPMAAYYGYKLFKGKMNRAALVCSIAGALFSLVVMQVAGVYITGAQVGYFFPPAYVLGLLPELLAAIPLTHYVFLALGIFLSWGYISRTSRHEVQNVAAIQATLQPYRRDAGAWAGPSAPSYKGPELHER